MTPAMTDDRCDVLILGASFAGIELYHQLRRHWGGRRLSVVIVDRQAAHGYIPLVQERLTERLPLARSELPTARCVVGDPHARYVVGEVVGFDPDAREVRLAAGERLRGRFVVVALGSTLAPPPALPGAGLLLGYKFAGEFADAHARLTALLTGAEPPVAADRSSEHPYREGVAPGELRIVVVGGGISGVELAGELAHLARARPPGWKAPAVTLVQSGARLLPDLCERAARVAERHLRAQGVDLRLGTRVERVGAGSVRLRGAGEAEELGCAAAFWAGGVRPAPVLAALGLPRTPAGWLQVGPTLQCFPTERPTRPDIFAIGDAARVVGGTGEWPTMQRAIECLWQAGLVARHLVRLAAEPPDYPRGVPSLQPHTLREDFPHGVSLGGASLVVYGRLVLDFPRLNTWFRRFLMRRYFARYPARPALPGPGARGPAPR
jgi:NADH dehydrogenase FAD-containing subunit